MTDRRILKIVLKYKISYQFHYFSPEIAENHLNQFYHETQKFS